MMSETVSRSRRQEGGSEAAARLQATHDIFLVNKSFFFGESGLTDEDEKSKGEGGVGGFFLFPPKAGELPQT